MLQLDAQLNDYPALNEHATKATELFPTQPEFYLYKGIAASQLKKNDEAIEALVTGRDLVVDNKPLEGNFWSSLGDAYNEAKDYVKSDAAYDKALAIKPDDATVLNNYAYYLRERNEQLDKAESMSRKCNDLQPGVATYLDTYAWIFYKQGKYAEARPAGKGDRCWWRKEAILIEHYGDILSNWETVRPLLNSGKSQGPGRCERTHQQEDHRRQAGGMIRAMRTLLLLCVVFFTACKPIREVLPFRGEIPARGPEKLLEQLLANRITDVRYYSAKANVDMKDSTGSKSFKAHVRCVTDSAVWISVVPALGIEVARALLTTDSLKVLDKLGDHFWIGDTAQATRKFGLAPDLSLFQQALLGMPIGLDAKEKYKASARMANTTLQARKSVFDAPRKTWLWMIPLPMTAT
ncbi:MAG: DUF4292 domain-containing protein [Flavobacteriales bacterium]|nr:DUF4292 domain-containing protein [Flavobacteriales bacterium]